MKRSRELVKRVMLEQGVPGAVVAVVRDGRVVWSEGLGLADVENHTPCTPDTVMRIASISKPLASVAVLQLYQRNLVDLDCPIQRYVPEFPLKKFEGEDVEVTVRLLLCHLAGVRHYPEGIEKGSVSDEYYIQSHFDSVEDSIKLFANDDLVCKPGSEFNYTTHGWTLLSAVVEKASGMRFLDYMRDNVLKPLGMTKTSPELNREIIYGRAKHYVRLEGMLKNTPYVDLSYKWAGGGYLSNAEDLARFGNAVLGCWQRSQTGATESDAGSAKCLLEPSTASLMLTPAVQDVRAKKPPTPSSSSPPIGYGMGWFLRQPREGLLQGKDYPFVFSHTGGAVGGSSVLTIVPQGSQGSRRGDFPGGDTPLPGGVAVAILFNLQGVKGVFELGLQVAEQFHNL